MQLLSVTPRLGAAAFFASTLPFAAGASADIAEINGNVLLDTQSEARINSVSSNKNDRFNANINTDPRFGIEPLDVTSGYTHSASIQGALATQDISTSVAYDASSLAFGFSGSASTEALTQDESADVSTRYDASFMIEAESDTFVDITITMEYTPGLDIDQVSAYIGVDGIDDLGTSFFEIDSGSSEIFATLRFRTMILGGDSVSIDARADYQLFAQGDDGFPASQELGFLGLSASVSVAPSPGSIGVLALGSLASIRRRR